MIPYGSGHRCGSGSLPILCGGPTQISRRRPARRRVGVALRDASPVAAAAEGGGREYNSRRVNVRGPRGVSARFIGNAPEAIAATAHAQQSREWRWMSCSAFPKRRQIDRGHPAAYRGSGHECRLSMAARSAPRTRAGQPMTFSSTSGRLASMRANESSERSSVSKRPCRMSSATARPMTGACCMP